MPGSVGGAQVITSLVALMGREPRRPRIANRVPTAMGSRSGVHEVTDGSMIGAVAGEFTASNTLLTE